MNGFINISQADASSQEKLSFTQALLRGLGRGDGLFMPASIIPLDNIPELLQCPFIERSVSILQHLIGADPLRVKLDEIVTRAFDFPLMLRPLDDQVAVLELFHGPSLSFKDFGARFLAGCMQHSSAGQSITVLTATSGDTGGAVAKAFYDQPNVQVVIIYPQHGVTDQQAAHFVGLGGNVISVAVEGSFDDCQRLAKQAFAEQSQAGRKLISANSINIARLLAQVCYYFELAAQQAFSAPLTVAIPSGNFGNSTAAMIACALGLPVKTVLAVTNENDTVPRYLLDGQWLPKSVVQTITNAIDIAAPNNFTRIEYLQRQQAHLLPVFQSSSISEQQTRAAMRELASGGYLADPHTALAWMGLRQQLGNDECGVVVATAHPAKFADEVQAITGVKAEHTPSSDSKLARLPLIPAEYSSLKKILDNYSD